ncbi:MAG: tetratricopeptide repeat protein [Bacteroidetes bacterium]|nr:MAG: tetratricopeptide repeat protein [Bacteroidota bacterium]
MKSILTTISAVVLLSACNQKSVTDVKSLEVLYKKSYDLKDISTAITSVQLILLQDSTHALRDSLPAMYLSVQNIDACLTTTEDALKRKPNDEELLKYKMLCLEQLGKGEELLTLSNDLYNKTKKSEYLYKSVSVQLAMGNFEVASKNIDDMMEKYKGSTDSVDMIIGEGQNQRVPILAACWNMRGYVYIQTQKYQQAAEAYQRAIQIFPDFVMARRNLQQLIQSAQQQR